MPTLWTLRPRLVRFLPDGRRRLWRNRSNVFEPTILTGLTPESPACYQEFFGPVAQVHVARSDDEIVELANDSRFGLGGSIFAGDVERAKSLWP